MLIKAKRHKPNVFVPVRANQGEAQLRRMAAMIQNEAQLESVLSTTKLDMRDACRARIRPFLRFKLADKPTSHE